jgi:ParB-like chromosome segregation protein Spo0J
LHNIVPRIINRSAELVSVSNLKPHPENARRGNLESIKNSIEYHGFYGYCVAEKNSGLILAGNHRFQAAVELGMMEVPVVWLDQPDVNEQRKILLADNKTNDDATYDTEALAQLLRELSATEQGIEGSGYDQDEMDELIVSLEPQLSGVATSDPNQIVCPHCGKGFTP